MLSPLGSPQGAQRGVAWSRAARRRGGSVILFAALGLAEHGCGRVPEQALRDEQARSRRYRDAYETLQEEVTALRARVAEKGCAARPAVKDTDKDTKGEPARQ